jgi:hypothetical protein
MPQSLGQDYASCGDQHTGMTQDMDNFSFGRTSSNENLPGWQNEWHPDQDKSDDSGGEENETTKERRSSRKAGRDAAAKMSASTKKDDKLKRTLDIVEEEEEGETKKGKRKRGGDDPDGDFVVAAEAKEEAPKRKVKKMLLDLDKLKRFTESNSQVMKTEATPPENKTHMMGVLVTREGNTFPVCSFIYNAALPEHKSQVESKVETTSNMWRASGGVESVEVFSQEVKCDKAVTVIVGITERFVNQPKPKA